jgi:hypothetical protein
VGGGGRVEEIEESPVPRWPVQGRGLTIYRWEKGTTLTPYQPRAGSEFHRLDTWTLDTGYWILDTGYWQHHGVDPDGRRMGKGMKEE